MSPVGQRRVGLAFGLTPFVCAVLGLFGALFWSIAGPQMNSTPTDSR